MFTKDDQAKFRAFHAAVSKAQFNLEGASLIAIANLKAWFDSLDSKLTEAIKLDEAQKALAMAEPKPMSEPIEIKKPKAK